MSMLLFLDFHGFTGLSLLTLYNVWKVGKMHWHEPLFSQRRHSKPLNNVNNGLKFILLSMAAPVTHEPPLSVAIDYSSGLYALKARCSAW